MASEQLQHTSKQTNSGRRYFGDKDVEYLKKKSREAVEDINDLTVLYFQLDWEKSKRNFYGELIIKKFVDTKGVQVRCMINMNQGQEEIQQGVPNQLMLLNVSVYVEQLKELGINPNYDDFFLYGQRAYRIYRKTLADYGPGNVLGNRERMRQDYFCVQVDDEEFQAEPWGDNEGLEYQIRSGNGDMKNH